MAAGAVRAAVASDRREAVMGGLDTGCRVSPGLRERKPGLNPLELPVPG